MCDPLTIGLTSVAIGSKIAGGIAANKAAKKQAAAITRNANESYGNQLADLSARAGEETSSAQFEAQNQRELSLAELGLNEAAAAEGNISGSTVDAATSALKRRANIAQDVTTSNLDAVLAQLARSARGAATERDSRINGAPQPQNFLFDTLGFAAQLAIPYLPSPKGGNNNQQEQQG